jgi:hypothetical protein
VLALAPSCQDIVLLCEPLVPGNGLGLHLLRAIDPALRQIVTDEVTEGSDRTRERKPWEPAARWVLASVRAWRFDADAELARSGFVARLSRMTAMEMIVVARRLLARFPRAHEVLVLAIHELVRRGDLDSAKGVAGELEVCTDAAPSLTIEARRALHGMPASVRATG